MKESSLYRLVEEERYDAALERVTSQDHDHEALWVDQHGETVLHHLVDLLWCDGTFDLRVIPIIEVIVTKFPHLVSMRNCVGMTPLHCLVSNVRVQFDRLLWITLDMIGSNPEAVRVPNSLGWTALHVACDSNAVIPVLRAILEKDPSLAYKSVLAEDVCFYGGEVGIEYLQRPADLLWKSSRDKSIMKKMALLVMTVHSGHVPEYLSYTQLLHAVSVQPCPRDYIMHLIHALPSLLYQRDHEGNLPLHCAVRSASPQDVDCDLEMNSPVLQKARVLHQLKALAYPSFVVEELLRARPLAAAVKNNESQLPLHVALSGCHPWSFFKGKIIRMLVKAYPVSLLALDTENRLYPVLMAALQASESTRRLSTTHEHELMRETPAVCGPFQESARDDDNQSSWSTMDLD